MRNNQYIYAVSRIRSKELSLLDKSFMEQLLASKSYEECLRLLKDKGWGRTGEESAEELLKLERDKTWDLISELVEDMSIFDTFLYGNDFHNLKAAIKQVYREEEIPNIFMTHGTLDHRLILEAIETRDFALLPEFMRACAEEAYEIQFTTGDSQLCDVIIDKATLDTISIMAKKSKNDLMQEYATLKVVAANINIAVRGQKTNKSRRFLELALATCDTLDKERLIESILEGEAALYNYLETTVYADAVDAIKESPSAFERWCDNLIINRIKPQKYNSFTVSPLAAYILARENEIKCVRIVLSGKLNDLPEKSLKERLRDMYV